MLLSPVTLLLLLLIYYTIFRLIVRHIGPPLRVSVRFPGVDSTPGLSFSPFTLAFFLPLDPCRKAERQHAWPFV